MHLLWASSSGSRAWWLSELGSRAYGVCSESRCRSRYLLSYFRERYGCNYGNGREDFCVLWFILTQTTKASENTRGNQYGRTGSRERKKENIYCTNHTVPHRIRDNNIPPESLTAEPVFLASLSRGLTCNDFTTACLHCSFGQVLSLTYY